MWFLNRQRESRKEYNNRLQKRAERMARRRQHNPIQPGEWLLDLGMPTDRAIVIKTAYDIQQRDGVDNGPPKGYGGL